MVIGKIVKSDSHINYVCQIYGPHEVESEPTPTDYAFGRFVRAAVRPNVVSRAAIASNDPYSGNESGTYVIGVIYDTILMNPQFGALSPRLSNEMQVELFSPDYLSEKAVVTCILLLGTVELQRNGQNIVTRAVLQGIPPFSLDLGSEIETMSDEEIRAFHFFADAGNTAFLHLGYLPHLIAQRNSLLPLVALQLIEQVERLFPFQATMLSIVKRNFAWRLKVETTG